MKCPECGLAMREEQHHGVTVDRCDGCRGLWFDPAEIDQVVHGKCEELHGTTPLGKWVEKELADHLEDAPVEEPAPAPAAGALCPRCFAGVVERGNIGGAQFWMCAGCRGVFFAGVQWDGLLAHVRREGENADASYRSMRRWDNVELVGGVVALVVDLLTD